jgi:hypothetical protein
MIARLRERSNAVVHRHTAHGNKRQHVGRAESRMLALMCAHVDEF